MTPKEMFYFIGKCLILDEYPEIKSEIVHQISMQSFSWEDFVQTGSSHLVLPALYLKLLHAGLLPCLPKELTLHMKKLYELNLERNKAILKQVNQLILMCRKSHIHPVFLKGAGALLDGLYDDPGERVLNDIDCLFSDTDFEKAVELLVQEGYTAHPFNPDSLPLMHHYPSLFKRYEPAPIEIHRYPVGIRQLKYLDVDELKTQLFASPASQQTFTLSYGDQQLVNFLHSQMKDHGHYHARVSLRNLYEFYRLSLNHELSDIHLKGPYVKRAFNSYVSLAAKVFRPAGSLQHKDNLSARWYISRLERNKTHRFWYRIQQPARTMLRLLDHYFYILLRTFNKSEYRIHLRTRMGDPAWYRHHLAVMYQSLFHST